jgi:acyl carrier protein
MKRERLLEQYTARRCGHWAGESVMVLEDVKTVVGRALQLGNRVRNLNEKSALLGAVPELDSMGVVSVITALEEHFEITVDDDEIGAAAFETLGSLTRFVEGKLAAA